MSATKGAGVKIREFVSILRSKNAGPMFLGFDLMFKDQRGYELGKKQITRKLVASLYGIPLQPGLEVIAYDPGRGIKVTIPRPFVSGEPEDADVYGCQQHVPLLDIELIDDFG